MKKSVKILIITIFGLALCLFAGYYVYDNFINVYSFKEISNVDKTYNISFEEFKPATSYTIEILDSKDNVIMNFDTTKTENEVVLDKSIKNDWVNRSHYYMKFYLFSYAICISVATVVASKILSGDKTMLDNYLKFLSTGGDVIPKDAFLILGIDIESKDTYVDAIKYFDSLIEKFEKIYDEEV